MELPQSLAISVSHYFSSVTVTSKDDKITKHCKCFQQKLILTSYRSIRIISVVAMGQGISLCLWRLVVANILHKRKEKKFASVICGKK
jgi:hypothetical protein